MKPVYLIRWREKNDSEPRVAMVRGQGALVVEIDRVKSGYGSYNPEPPQELEVYELNVHTMQTLKVPEPQVVFRA